MKMFKSKLRQQLLKASFCTPEVRAKSGKAVSNTTFIVTEEQIMKSIYGNHNEPPSLPSDSECCESGCQNCVWLKYLIELKYYTKNDKRKMKEALNMIKDINIRAFVELEMKIDAS